jgi:HK97 gp10 family phage protein
MLMPKIKVEGIEELKLALKDGVTMKHVKSLIRFEGKELKEKIIRNADFEKGYQTGTTKGSVDLIMKDDGLTADAGPTTEYSGYVEFGTRFMEAQPFVKPAFDAQKKQFKKDLQRLSK